MITNCNPYYCSIKKYPCINTNVTFYTIRLQNMVHNITVSLDIEYFYQGMHFHLAVPNINYPNAGRLSVPKNSTSVQIRVFNTSVRPAALICERFVPFSTNVNLSLQGTSAHPHCVDTFNNFYC